MSKYLKSLTLALALGSGLFALSGGAETGPRTSFASTGMEYPSLQKISKFKSNELNWLIDPTHDPDLASVNLEGKDLQNFYPSPLSGKQISEPPEASNLDNDQLAIGHFDFLDLISELKNDPSQIDIAHALIDVLTKIPKQDNSAIRISDFDQFLRQNPLAVYRTWEFLQARKNLISRAHPIKQPIVESLRGVYWDDPEVITSLTEGAIIGSTFTPRDGMHAASHLNYSFQGAFTLGLYQINRTGHSLYLTNILKVPDDYSGEPVKIKVHHYVSGTTLQAPYHDLNETAVQVAAEDPYRQGPAMYATDLALDGFNQSGIQEISLKPGEMHVFPGIHQANREEIALQAKFESLNGPVQIATVYTDSNSLESVMAQISSGKRIDLQANPDAQAFERVAGIQLEASQTSRLSNHEDPSGVPVMALVLPPDKSTYTCRVENHGRTAFNNGVIGYPGTSRFDYGDYGNERLLTANLYNPTDRPKVFEIFTYNLVSARHNVSRALRQSFQVEVFDGFGKLKGSKRLFLTQAPGLNDHTVERLLYQGELPDFDDREPLLFLILQPGERTGFQIRYIYAANNFDSQYMAYRIREEDGLPIALQSYVQVKSRE